MEMGCVIARHNDMAWGLDLEVRAEMGQVAHNMSRDV